jgi:hypothetical protein
MPAMHLRRLFLGILALGLLVPGCSEKSKLVKVSGIVYGPDGKEGLGVHAVIIFQPTESGSPATGIIYDDGRFSLTTFAHDDGALPGKYKVVIRLADSMDTDPVKAHKRLVNMDKKEAVDPKKRAPLIHPNYLDPVRTPLTQDVPTSGEVQIHLNKDGT